MADPVKWPAKAPQGWYSDPQSAETLRYWDGSEWTGYTSPLERALAPGTSPAGSTAPAADQPPRKASREDGASYTYDAFVSYSHQDQAVAAGVQKGLHRIGRRVGRVSALRVFRDSTELAATPDLWGRVTEAMDRSRYLIVVLSPRAATSEWVNKEVEHWLTHRGPEKLMIVLAEGQLHWDAATQRFNPDQSDAAPKVLTEQREPGVLPTEPLFVDVSTDAPWDDYTPAFRDKLTNLAAPIHGKSKYELASDDLREQRRFRRLRRAAIAALALLTVTSLAAASWTLSARGRADEIMRQAVAEQLTASGQATLTGARGGDDVRAIQEILAAQRISTSAEVGALLTGVNTRRDTLKIIQAPGQLLGVAFSPDGTRVASACDDNTVRIWSSETGQPLGEPLTGHTDRVRSVVFSPDGSRLATAGLDNTVRLWNAENGQPIGEPLRGQYWVFSAAFSPDGTRIASAGADGTLQLWRTDTGQPIGKPLVGHTDSVYGVAFSPDGTRIASASADGTVRVWRGDDGQPIGQPFTGHTGEVFGVAFSPDGNRIASASADRTIRLWNAETGQPIGKPMTGHTAEVFSAAFSPDGRLIVSASADSTVRLWNPENGQSAAEPLKGHFGRVQNAVFSADGNRIASAGADSTLRLWNAQAVETRDRPLIGHTAAVNAVAFSPNGSRIASGSSDGTVRLWDPNTGQTMGEAGVAPVSSVAFSPDGTRVATANSDGSVQLWNADNGQPIGKPMTDHTNGVNAVAFSPDGSRIATGRTDGTVLQWNADTGQPIGKPMVGHINEVLSVAFSPDGSKIVSGSADYTVRLWNADNGLPIGEPEPELLGHNDRVFSVAFSPDSRRVASGSLDGTIRLWNADTLEPIGEPFTGHTNGVAGVAFSPDGALIASGSLDGTVRLWKANNDRLIPFVSTDGSPFEARKKDTGQPVGQPLTGHSDAVYGVAFSPDGRRIVSASGDKTLRLWPIPSPDEWTGLLCSKLTTNMSRYHWSEWVSTDVDYIELCPGLPVAQE